ncbi:polysaccharide biosynthesis tyrosine autokinase [Neomicrococcus aestuarii]|uniref:non-specific protein-tyrosine kinase n=1 Tax=Neomicrococcus aestuarii TaxID=556325 RepID=A0A1L2ZMQ6_9MICC|nr:polysaccharide biosynthesis tyrosine autokinase [Neomicrococcus aestuarii]APF40480.1 hypothetical protein BHE16_04965 [Neomicrococcus aestuarii]
MPIDEDQRQGEGLRILMAVVRRFWPVLLIATLVGALCGFGWAALQPKMYQSTSSGLIVTPKSSTVGEAIAGNSLAQDRAGSYAVMASSQRTAERAVEKLEKQGVADVPDAGSLISSITAAVLEGSTELRVTASASDPVFAQQLANVWIDALAEEAHDIESTGVDGVDKDFQPAVELMPMTEGTLPTSPYAPNVNQAVLIGAVVGLVLGLIWAAIKHLLDRRVRSVEAIQKVGMSAVGTLPSDPRLSRGRQVLPVVYSAETRTDRSYHAYSEALRELRTNLAYMDVDNPPRVIVVTSSVPGEGKSSLSANLAVTIAHTGQKVIVVDGDLRRPVVSEMFSLPGDAGLTDVLAGQAELDDVLQDFEPVPNLQVLAAGRIPPNPSELLASKTMGKLLEDLSERAFVIIDAPPLLPVTDGAVLAKASDGALIVVKAGKPTIDELAKATENLDRVGANKLGVILNQVPTRGAEASRYGYYGKYYSKKETKAKAAADLQEPSVTDNPPTEQIQTPASVASRSRHNEGTRGTSSQSMTVTKPAPDNFDEIVFRGTRAKRSDES